MVPALSLLVLVWSKVYNVSGMTEAVRRTRTKTRSTIMITPVTSAVFENTKATTLSVTYQTRLRSLNAKENRLQLETKTKDQEPPSIYPVSEPQAQNCEEKWLELYSFSYRFHDCISTVFDFSLHASEKARRTTTSANEHSVTAPGFTIQKPSWGRF